MLDRFDGESEQDFALREMEEYHAQLIDRVLLFADSRTEQEWNQVANFLSPHFPDLTRIFCDVAYEQGSRYARSAHDTTRKYTTFEQYMAAVDGFMVGECGLTHMDIDDWMWRSAFDSGTPPEEAARDAMINAGYPEDGFDGDELDDSDAYYS